MVGLDDPAGFLQLKLFYDYLFVFFHDHSNCSFSVKVSQPNVWVYITRSNFMSQLSLDLRLIAVAEIWALSNQVG